MPLLPGKNNVGHNISEMERGGHPRAQSIAAALREARRPLAEGGKSGKTESSPIPRLNFMGGLIHSTVPGRTDKLNLSVPEDSYILPADIVSALGEGNTFAGAATLDRVFSGQPYGAKGGPYGAHLEELTRHGHGAPGPSGPPAPPPGPNEGNAAPTPPHFWNQTRETSPEHFAKGGATAMVPVVVAGGEYAVPPKIVARLRGGDMDAGHEALDNFVRGVRAELAKVSQKLPGPKH